MTVMGTITTATIMSDKRRTMASGEGERCEAKAIVARHATPIEASQRGGNSPEETAALYRLMAWLSPSFPVGAFSYSSGIEWAVEAGDISDAATLADWLSLMMSDGAGFCDAVLFVQAHRAVVASDAVRLRDVAELAAAFSPSKERHLETTAQGRAFVLAVRGGLAVRGDRHAGRVVGRADRLSGCGRHRLRRATASRLETALPAFLHAIAANWISAGVRLIPLGQTDGQRVLAAMEAVIAATAARALNSTLDDIGGAALRADIGSMRHETQYTRLFRS